VSGQSAESVETGRQKPGGISPAQASRIKQSIFSEPDRRGAMAAAPRRPDWTRIEAAQLELGARSGGGGEWALEQQCDWEAGHRLAGVLGLQLGLAL